MPRTKRTARRTAVHTHIHSGRVAKPKRPRIEFLEEDAFRTQNPSSRLFLVLGQRTVEDLLVTRTSVSSMGIFQASANATAGLIPREALVAVLDKQTPEAERTPWEFLASFEVEARLRDQLEAQFATAHGPDGVWRMNLRPV